ncbi:ferritin-like domain-containing protein [uncultured Kriegella sp.]|uniref:YciE/YciF ferroxidase family protein n=1 Tax=uncultured Kriegella sp. TaxID=1798910 RepID=UPI0030DB91ED|tara:strand:- start:108885 stop:109376 length:492 start_codon:yes stop_codon:yes gene_type:complete
MKTLEDLFEHQLKDLYSVEIQLVPALSTMAKMASDYKLRRAFENHLRETKEQKNRLEAILDELHITPQEATCKTMEGLIKEVKIFISQAEDDEVIDIGLMAEAQRVEHYEISGYGTAIRYARELGYRAIANKLQDSLNEEYDADNIMGKLAEVRLNKKAINEI